MKKLKHVKLFENFQSAKTLGELVGNVQNEISDTLLKTDKGILINGFYRDEYEDYEMANQIEVEDEMVYVSGRNTPRYCLAIDNDGNIKALSSIPGDYIRSEFDGTIFKVYGHDGIETINIIDETQGFVDRGDFEEDEEWY